MNILIIGAGAIGITMGTVLCGGGAEVTFLARGETLKAIQEGGIHRTGLLGTADWGPEEIIATDSYDTLPAGHFDYVIISVKAMANETVCEQLYAHRSIFAPAGRLVLFQNGWGNDEVYLRRFPKEQVCGARIVTGFARTAPNVSDITVHSSAMLLGNLYGLHTAPLIPLAETLNAGGFPAEVTEDLAAALWAKMLYNCSLNPLGAVLGLRYGDLMKAPEGVEIMSEIVEEIYAVMEACGYHTYWSTAEDYKRELFDHLVPGTAAHISSTLQDIRRRLPTEIDILTGKVMELGAAHGVDTPINRMLYRQIKLLEANY